MEKRDFRKVGFQKEDTAETKDMVFGIRAVEESLKSGKEVEKMYIEKDQQNLRHFISEAKDRNIPVSLVPIEKLNRLTRKNHQGIICFTSPINYSKIENIIMKCFEEGRNPLVLLLDRITDVRNFGAICRTAECASVDAILIPARGSALITSDAIKTSSGALNYIPVCRENNLKETILFLKNSGLQLIACTEKATENIYSQDLKLPTAFIMGSEEDGVSPEYLKQCDGLVKIPMLGQISSLNVSVAAGIIIYEAIRQRL